MQKIIDAVCAHIHNYFEGEIASGIFTITGGALDLALTVDKYYLIRGSALNDGVFWYPYECLRDEVFEGTVTEMKLPPAFLDIVREIKAWQEKYADVSRNPYTRESVIGVYSYGKAAGADNWQQVFRRDLNRWRRL